ncbi:MAG: glycosyltransferase family 39 protein [Chloroflexi bacterium]|nr:glycosyltransferase family 39 protein [Chloroflexota bacterium]
MSSGTLERIGPLAGASRGTAATVRAQTTARTRALVIASAVVLFLVALYPRMINLTGYLTTDEGNWMGRTALFTRGLTQNIPTDTYQSGHPGVMTMWSSLIGMGPARALALVEYVRPDGLEKAPNYLETLHLARRTFAVLTSFGVVVIALLSWRLFGAGVGLIAGVLLALEPFFLAHSVVAHVDSNITTWMTVCIFSAMIYFWAGGSISFLILSGVAAGLAFLSKAPSAFLPIFVPIIALGSMIARKQLGNGPAWVRLVRDGLAWGVLALVVAMLLWPSFRTDPIGTLRQMIDYTETVGGSDHENFFMGQPVGDPGPLYYVVALAFRLTPATMLGLVLLVVGLLPFGRRIPAGWSARLAILGVFIVLFILMMASAPKKFDRYLLPVFPTVEVLAAVGFWLLLRRIRNGAGIKALPALLLVLGVSQAVLSAYVYPYYLAYYTPLLGGGVAARRTFVVGWGEGLDIVTDYLNKKPDAERMTVAGFYPRVMSAQFKGTVLSDKQYDAAMADYIVLYVNAVQRDLASRLRMVTRGKRSEMVVKINGIEYARLFAVPPPPRRNAAGTEMARSLRLERAFLKSDERPYLKSDDLNPGDTIEMTLRWAVLRPIDEDLQAVVQLVDLKGNVVAEDALPVGGPDSRTSTMKPNDIAIDAHRILLPNAIAEYNVVVGVRRPSGEWVEITSVPERLAQEARRFPSRVVVDSVDAK